MISNHRTSMLAMGAAVCCILSLVCTAEALPWRRRTEEADINGGKYTGPTAAGVCAFQDFDDAGINMANMNGPGTTCDGKCSTAGAAKSEDDCLVGGDDCCKWSPGNMLHNCSLGGVQAELYRGADLCCDEVTETCSSDGWPTTCNLGCAAVLIPVTTECLHSFPKLGLQSSIVPLQTAVKQCPCAKEILLCEEDAPCQEAIDILTGLNIEEYAEFFAGDDGDFDHFNSGKQPSAAKTSLLKCYQGLHISAGPPPPSPEDLGENTSPGTNTDMGGSGEDGVDPNLQPPGPLSYIISGTVLNSKNVAFMGTYTRGQGDAEFACNNAPAYTGPSTACPVHFDDDGVRIAFMWRQASGEWAIGCDFIEHTADVANCDATWGSGVFFQTVSKATDACKTGPDAAGCAASWSEASGQVGLTTDAKPNPTIKATAVGH